MGRAEVFNQNFEKGKNGTLGSFKKPSPYWHSR